MRFRAGLSRIRFTAPVRDSPEPANRMKRDKVNYTLVGIVVVAALALLIVSLVIITGKGGPSVSYLVRYRNVTGLAYGAPVLYEGYRIGQVESITPRREPKGTHYMVELAVRRDWSIPKDSLARLSSSGLLGDIAIAIREGKSPTFLPPGAEIKGEEASDVFGALSELSGEITVLTRDHIRPLIDTLGRRLDSITTTLDERTPAILDQARDLLVRLNSTVTSVDDVLRLENRENIAATLASIRAVSEDLKGTQAKLNEALEDVAGIAKENRPVLQETVQNLSQITASVARRIDAIAHNLESSSRNLDEFSREIRKSPNRLLFTPPADEVEVESESE